MRTDPPGMLTRSLLHQVEGMRASLRAAAQLRLVVENMRDVLYAISVPEGLITFISPQVSAWDVTPDEILGRPFFDFIDPADQPLVAASFADTADTGAEMLLQFTLVTPAGRRIPVEEAGRVIRDGERIVQIAGVLRDISERLATQAELARYRDRLEELVAERTAALRRANARLEREISERKSAEADVRRHVEELRVLSRTAGALLERQTDDELFRYIVEQVRVMAGQAVCNLATYDPQTREVTVRVLAASPEALQAVTAVIGRPLDGMRIPVPAEAYGQLARGVLTTLPGGLFELCFGQLPAPLCEAITHQLDIGEVCGMPIIDEHELLGTVGICMRQGHHLRNRELIATFVTQASVAVRRNRVEAALAQERATVAAAVDMLPLPFWIMDTDFNALVNPAAAAFLQRTGLTGRRAVQYLDARSRALIPQEQRSIARALAGEVVVGRELIMLAGDGTEVPVITHAAPIRLDGTIAGAVGVIEDITALKEADRAKDEFLATLSHELQTPLTSILSWTELARNTQDPDILSQAIEVIYLNAQRQKTLVAEMLDMSRLIYRKLNLEPHLLDLGYEAHLALLNFQRQANERHITLELEERDTPLLAMVDPTRLQQCLSNLLQNSLKFTSSGGRILITCAREDTLAVLAVTDTGCGMTAEVLNCIFAPFRQVQRNGGLGLGLALVHGIIELHGGTVEAESPGLGQGSTIRIRLPLHRTEP